MSAQVSPQGISQSLETASDRKGVRTTLGGVYSRLSGWPGMLVAGRICGALLLVLSGYEIRG